MYREGREIKSIRPMFKTEMLFYQSKAKLDEKISFGKITDLSDPKIFILFHDLRGIEVYMVSFSNKILILTASKLWTRMECEILVPNHARYQHFPNF